MEELLATVYVPLQLQRQEERKLWGAYTSVNYSRCDSSVTSYAVVIKACNVESEDVEIGCISNSVPSGKVLEKRKIYLVFEDTNFLSLTGLFIDGKCVDLSYVVADKVQILLEWLKGNPAGLKLNQPLTQALAAFFSYHVHLWALYLELANPFLKSIAWVIMWLGLCGVSMQIALLADLVGIATVHLYCFYVYASRIQMLQMSLAGSQWRAFRGRKWNPLKKREDTYDPDHKTRAFSRVLTAVVFTLVIFLLPTTCVYYFVFVTLRIILYAVRNILNAILWGLNYNPASLLLLQLARSSKVKGSLSVDLMYEKTHYNSPLYLCMSAWPSPLSELISFSNSSVFTKFPSPKWKYLLNSIIYAKELI